MNLYRMVHKDKIVEIYNSQNENKVSLVDKEEFMDIPSKELEYILIEIYKDQLQLTRMIKM